MSSNLSWLLAVWSMLLELCLRSPFLGFPLWPNGMGGVSAAAGDRTQLCPPAWPSGLGETALPQLQHRSEKEKGKKKDKCQLKKEAVPIQLINSSAFSSAYFELNLFFF